MLEVLSCKYTTLLHWQILLLFPLYTRLEISSTWIYSSAENMFSLRLKYFTSGSKAPVDTAWNYSEKYVKKENFKKTNVLKAWWFFYCILTILDTSKMLINYSTSVFHKFKGYFPLPALPYEESGMWYAMILR